MVEFTDYYVHQHYIILGYVLLYYEVYLVLYGSAHA